MPLPTPDDAPIVYTARRLLVPSVLALRDALAGGLSTYIFRSQWTAQGTMSPERAAEALKVSWLSTIRPPSEIGQVAGFLRSDTPDGWLPFDGGTYNGNTYPDLFAVLPDTIKTGNFFTLPEQNDWSLHGVKRGIGSVGLAEVFGDNKHVLTEAQLPPHNHGYLYPTAQPLIAGAPESILTGFTAPAISRTTTTTGNGDSFDKRGKLLAVNYFIYSGVYDIAI